MSEDTPSLTAEQLSAAMREIGRRGGMKTRERHGVEHFRRIGQKGADAIIAKQAAKDSAQEPAK